MKEAIGEEEKPRQTFRIDWHCQRLLSARNFTVCGSPEAMRFGPGNWEVKDEKRGFGERQPLANHMPWTDARNRLFSQLDLLC